MPKDEFWKQDFYGRDFWINKNVLIPRPESEMIIDAVLNLAGKSYLPGVKASASEIADDLTILDVGTGSGILAITLKLELPQSKVVGCDISEEALEVARKNAGEFGAKVKFTRSDLLKNVECEPDLIVANLPYVNEEWEWIDREALAREPRIALFAKNHGLAVILRLIDELPQATRFLVLEADPCQHEKVIEYAEKHRLVLKEKRNFAMVFAKSFN